MRIGLVIKPDLAEAKKEAENLIAWGKKNGHEIIADSEILPKIKFFSKQDLPSKVDVIVSLGGDGSLIGIARYVRGETPPVLGVNLGKLGFLAEVSKDELISTLEAIQKGKASYSARSVLAADVIRGGKNIFSSFAVNDVVVHKGARDRLVELDVAVSGEGVMRIRADGLIFSTPTGSTAYNLAAGGPIVHPAVPVFIMTPICAHSLTNRPIILGGESSVEVNLPEYEGELHLTADGQETCLLKSGDKIEVRKAPHKIRLVKSQTKTYLGVLQAKLNWGRPNEYS